MKSEQISREKEIYDLAAPIRYLGTLSRRSADEPIPVIGEFILAVDPLIGAVPA
jgi:hypothetical protein